MAAPHRRLQQVFQAAALLLLIAITPGWAAASPLSTGEGGALAIYLTWQRDPTTTMTVDWHTAGAEARLELEYRRLGDQRWDRQPAVSFPFPHSDRYVHRVELTGLEPDATYEIRTSPAVEPYRFRTLPAQASRPIRFAAGGDVRHDAEWMARTGRHAAAYDLDFVVWGGDLAYGDGRPDRAYRWHEWFEAIHTAMSTPDRRLVPVLPAIGNHEVNGSYHHRIADYRQDDATRNRIAPFFYPLLASPGQPGYRAIDAGDYLSVILLDTDHTNPVDGAQTRWLARALAEREGVTHVLPVYHVPAYPSVRAFDGRVSARVREHWVPLFERHGVRFVFEAHDHVYKRTHPMRGGVRDDQDGIVYLGDGAWGVGVRPIGRDQGGMKAPYLARAESVRHFILGEIEGPDLRFAMIDEDGELFDEYPAGAAAVIGEPRFPVRLQPAAVTETVFHDSDDAAIWVHPTDPSLSLVLGTDKHETDGGVYVFGLDGRIDRERTRTGMRRVNNVDVAQGVVLGGERMDIAVATERLAMAIRVFRLPDMTPIDGGGIPVFDGDMNRAPMGVALYTRPSDGATYAFVSGKSGPRQGYLRQYRLEADGTGEVRGVKVREFGAFSGRKEIEAIAVDQALGYVYYSDETFGARKYHADPDAGDEELALFGTMGFVGDQEGIAIYTRDDGTGYILVSDQHGRRLQVFPREGSGGDPHAHPVLAVIPVEALDTDGIAVTPHPLGPAFPHGLLVLMSTDRTFHLYRWEDVAAWIRAESP
jgi:myo-inositol-hexaphosphate 3-phosphohydrolase